jgi:hypothetical protein
MTVDAKFWDNLRDFIENAWKAIANLLNELGEWPLFEIEK